MKQKLIISDIDGTLLRMDKSISETTRNAIFSYIEQGHPFAIATGRMHAAGKIVTQKLDYDGFLISCNGAVVKHLKTNEIIHAVEIPQGIAAKVTEVCEKYGAYFHYYAIDEIFASRRSHLALKYFEEMPSLPEQFQFQIEFASDCGMKMIEYIGKIPIYKIGVYHEDAETYQSLMREVRAIEGTQTCMSLQTSFDVMAQGISKASGIEAIRQHYQIEVEDVIAFGDNENDLDMISYAGKGVAMANATEALKSAADFVTKSNDEDGLVYALEQLMNE